MPESHSPPRADAVSGGADDRLSAGDATLRPEVIAERYRVLEILGLGGMGAVYRVFDDSTHREVALKRLQVPAQADDRAVIEALFEQEFRTLAQLDHPRVVRVYDYGTDRDGAYYTMELLDSVGLGDCAPLPWREACVLAHDVGSSLALLHARRLIHRDVSPHNVRRTRDGRAKLIDFGAMAAMGPCEQVIGTPAFTAPEVAHRLTLDARCDLFSLGATLYFALTGQLAYSARTFSQLQHAWSVRPASPSALVHDIPAQLDALVMSLLSLEPALRPRSAAEVMQQLAGLAGIDPDEHLDLARVYLATPELVGRNALLSEVERRAQHITRASAGRGSVSVQPGC
jgi:eukaryotic-like serine/threonine-protein kinase